jgi:hypothetical protein
MNETIVGPDGLPKTTRPPCPFYGFIRKFNQTMSDCHGNGCAMEGGGNHSPCKMVSVEGKPADWKSCKFYNNEQWRQPIANLCEVAVVYPDELRPDGIQGWQGVSLKGWFAVMAR